MKICQDHWNKLRAAIEECGLSHLIAKDGKAAAQQIQAQLQGDQSATNYDPLMAANFAIWSVSLHHFGLGIMAGDVCPLCLKTEIEKDCTDPKCNKETGDDWVRFAAEGQLAYARSQGLVPEAS